MLSGRHSRVWILFGAFQISLLFGLLEDKTLKFLTLRCCSKQSLQECSGVTLSFSFVMVRPLRTQQSPGPLCPLGLLVLVDPIDDALVQRLLVVRDGSRLVVLQPGVLPYLLQGVVLHQAAILKDGHQQVLKTKSVLS